VYALSVENCLQSMLTLLSLVVVGVFLGKKGIIREQGEETLTRLTVQFSIPFLLFDNARKYITLAFLKEVGLWLLIPAGVIVFQCVVSYALAPVLKVKKGDRGLFMVMMSFSNSILIGLPIVTEVFGEPGVPYNIAYYIPSTILFWTIGNTFLARDGGRRLRFGLDALRAIFSPALMGLIVGVAVSFSGIMLPDFLSSAVKYLANLTIPLSLLLTGVFLAKMGTGAFKFGSTGTLVLLGRLLISPALILTLCLLFKAEPLMTGVYTVVASMPIMNQSVLLSREYGGNYMLAAQMITVTTLLSVVMLPAVVYLLTILTA
jgi:predicted permease